jgi:hypothetical protein
VGHPPFATDGGSVVAFSVPSLAPTWTYTSTAGSLSLVAATSGGGVTINDSQQGVIQLDSTGTPGAPIASLQGAIPSWHGDWDNISGDPTLQQVYAAPLGLPSPWTEPGGNPSANRQSALQETLYLRSFAPWPWFGPEPAPPVPAAFQCFADCFKGDNRSFSTTPTQKTDQNPSITSRINGKLVFEVPGMILISSDAWPNQSRDWAGRTDYSHDTKISVSQHKNAFDIHLWGNNPLVPGSPDIDTHLTITAQAGQTQICYGGYLFGDAFPNSEAFVVNSQNSATSLITFATPDGRNNGPALDLPGDNARNMGTFFQCVLQ